MDVELQSFWDCAFMLPNRISVQFGGFQKRFKENRMLCGWKVVCWPHISSSAFYYKLLDSSNRSDQVFCKLAAPKKYILLYQNSHL